MLFVTSNRSEFPISRVSGLISRAIFDEDYELPPATVDLKSDTLRSHVGLYALAKGGELEIGLRAGRLVMTAEGDPAATRLFAASQRSFFSYSIRGADGLQVEFGEDGQSLLLRRGDTMVPAKRR